MSTQCGSHKNIKIGFAQSIRPIDPCKLKRSYYLNCHFEVVGNAAALLWVINRSIRQTNTRFLILMPITLDYYETIKNNWIGNIRAAISCCDNTAYFQPSFEIGCFLIGIAYLYMHFEWFLDLFILIYSSCQRIFFLRLRKSEIYDSYCYVSPIRRLSLFIVQKLCLICWHT